MVYIPRGFQYVNAVLFDGWSKTQEDVSKFGVQKLPQGAQVQCDCGNPSYEHGLLNNQLVCPGIYILYEGSKVASVMRKDAFEQAYKPFSDNVVSTQ